MSGPFLHNPKLLTARGALQMPAGLQAQLSARGLASGANAANAAAAAVGLAQQAAAAGGGQASHAGHAAIHPPKGAAVGKPSPLGLGGSGGGASSSGKDDTSAETKKVPGLSIPSPEPMPHLDLATPSQRSARGTGPTTDNKENDEFDLEMGDLFKRDPHSLSYLDLALPGSLGGEEAEWGMGDGYGDGNMEMSLDQQLAELSGLLGGDANAPQFLQEMLMLQMQAEAWRMQWSVAMQENEELRSKLYDTRNSLEAAGGGGASGEHWRELCISIAKSAEDEKGQILEQIGNMREELERTMPTVEGRQSSVEELRQQASTSHSAAEPPHQHHHHHHHHHHPI